MTKREFDAATKENWGGAWMASDERRSYRARRLSDDQGGDYLARRARELKRLRSALGKEIALFDVGTRWRAPASWAAGQGRTLLTGRI